MRLANFTSKLRADLIITVYSGWMKSSDRVLDVGCGTGVVTEYLGRKLKIKITGCDIENYLIRKIPFILMTKPNVLPFKNRQFEVVMLNDVLHHMPKNKQNLLLKEATRVGKKVLIFEVHPNISGKFFDYIINKIHNSKMEIPWSFRDKTGWEKLFSKLNLKSQGFVVRRPFFYPVRHIAFKLK